MRAIRAEACKGDTQHLQHWPAKSLSDTPSPADLAQLGCDPEAMATQKEGRIPVH